MYDFTGNTYTLQHLDPQGYIIVDDTTEEVMEACFKNNSPYNFSKIKGKKYYVGPLNYLVEHGNKYYDVFNDKDIKYSNGLKESSDDLNNRLRAKFYRENEKINT